MKLFPISKHADGLSMMATLPFTMMNVHGEEQEHRGSAYSKQGGVEAI